MLKLLLIIITCIILIPNAYGQYDYYFAEQGRIINPEIPWVGTTAILEYRGSSLYGIFIHHTHLIKKIEILELPVNGKLIGEEYIKLYLNDELKEFDEYFKIDDNTIILKKPIEFSNENNEIRIDYLVKPDYSEVGDIRTISIPMYFHDLSLFSTVVFRIPVYSSSNLKLNILDTHVEIPGGNASCISGTRIFTKNNYLETAYTFWNQDLAHSVMLPTEKTQIYYLKPHKNYLFKVAFDIVYENLTDQLIEINRTNIPKISTSSSFVYSLDIDGNANLYTTSRIKNNGNDFIWSSNLSYGINYVISSFSDEKPILKKVTFSNYDIKYNISNYELIPQGDGTYLHAYLLQIYPKSSFTYYKDGIITVRITSEILGLSRKVNDYNEVILKGWENIPEKIDKIPSTYAVAEDLIELDYSTEIIKVNLPNNPYYWVEVLDQYPKTESVSYFERGASLEWDYTGNINKTELIMIDYKTHLDSRKKDLDKATRWGFFIGVISAILGIISLIKIGIYKKLTGVLDKLKVRFYK